MKKMLVVGASVVLLWLWMQRKYKAVVEEVARRQGRSSVRWASDTERPPSPEQS